MTNKPEYWYCCIGPADRNELGSAGADSPMRQAVKSAFVKLTRHHPDRCLSGWGVPSSQVSEVSFATYSESEKRASIASYVQEEKSMPPYVLAWHLYYQRSAKEVAKKETRKPKYQNEQRNEQ